MTANWIFLALLSAFFAALVILFQGKLTQITPMLQNSRALSFIILSGLAGALSWLFYFLALKSGTATQVATLDRLSVVFVIIIAALFLGEKITPLKALGTSLVAAGAILIALG